MLRIITLLALYLVTSLSTSAFAQTAEESTEKLAELLTHRRDEVRMKAFGALKEQAKSGKDLTISKPELLKFANLNYKDSFTEKESEEYQLIALQILVQVDDAIAQKVLDRTEQFVEAYLVLNSRGDSSIEEIYSHIINGFQLLRFQKDPQPLRQIGEMAERLMRVASKYKKKELLEFVYLKYPQAQDRLAVPGKFGLRVEYLRSEDCYPKLLEALYNSEIDEQTVQFAANLPEVDHPYDREHVQHAYLLGLLVSRSKLAKQEALKFLRDEYETKDIRRAVSCGILAGCSTEDDIYWEADRFIEANRNGFHNHLDCGPQFTEEMRKANHEVRFPKQPTPQKPVAKKPVQPKSTPSTPANDAVLKAAVMRQDDSQDFQKIIIPLLREIHGEFKAGQIKVSVPRSVYDQIREEANKAKSANRPGLAQMLERMIQGWELAITQGRAQIVD